MAWRIRARGHLDPAWGDRLGGLRVAHEGGGSRLLALETGEGTAATGGDGGAAVDGDRD